MECNSINILNMHILRKININKKLNDLETFGNSDMVWYDILVINFILIFLSHWNGNLFLA